MRRIEVVRVKEVCDAFHTVYPYNLVCDSCSRRPSHHLGCTSQQVASGRRPGRTVLEHEAQLFAVVRERLECGHKVMRLTRRLRAAFDEVESVRSDASRERDGRPAVRRDEREAGEVDIVVGIVGKLSHSSCADALV